MRARVVVGMGWVRVRWRASCLLLLMGILGCKSEQAPSRRPATMPTTASTLRSSEWTGQEHTNSIGMKLRRIPAGEFTMGDNYHIDTKPVHRVQVSEFWTGVYEVTNAQYELFDREHRQKRPESSRGDDFPVSQVTWDQAMAFCRWLSEREGVEYRLPTEAEWEYAARGGLEGKSYSWGDEEPWADDTVPPETAPERRASVARLLGAVRFPSIEEKQKGLRACLFPYSVYSTGPEGSQFNYSPRRVGTYAPNGYGLYDTIGNVLEYCWDDYDPDYYGRSPAKDPRCSGAWAAMAVTRGGSFRDPPEYQLVAERWPFLRAEGDDCIGFRVVRSAAPLKVHSGPATAPAVPSPP